MAKRATKKGASNRGRRDSKTGRFLGKASKSKAATPVKAKRHAKRKSTSSFPIQSRAVKPLSSEKKAHVRGRPEWEAPIKPRKTSGKRPLLERIKQWAKRRLNVVHWRNHDGSYDAIATFRGSRAWDFAEMAARSAPRPCYLSFRFLIKEEYTVERSRRTKSGPIAVSETKERLVPDSTPIVRGSNWGIGHQFVFGPELERERDPNFNAGVYLRLAGLAVRWPKP